MIKKERLYKNKELLYDQYIVQNKPITQIAKEYNVTGPSIRYWIKKFNIKIKPKGIYTPWNKGLTKKTNESLRKMSENKKGIKKPEHSKRMSGKNNPFYGKHHTKETKKKLSEGRKGKNNPSWKGNKASINSIHRWVETEKPKIGICSICNNYHKKTYLANIDHKYKRNRDDFFELCIYCHRLYDGIRHFGWNAKESLFICKKITKKR